MKIAFIGQRGIPARFGGVEKHVEELGTRLAARGHQVVAYTRWNYNKFTGLYKGIHVISRPAIPQKHTEMISHTFISLLDLMDKDIDIIHIHSVDLGGRRIIKKNKTKVVVTSHGQAYRREKWGPVAKWASRLAERAFICFPDSRIVVSKTLKKYYEQTYNRNVFYIPNGIDIHSENNNECLAQWDLSKDNYVLFVGRIMPTKGCDRLVEAFKRVETDKKLVCVGGSSYTDAYYEKLKDSADTRTIFLGYQYGQELVELYSNAYCVVIPSEIEGLALTLLEAMSYGKCVIYSDIPENVEVAEGVGIPFHTRNIDDLAEKMTYALEHPAYCNELGAKARERVRKEYDWDKITDQTEQVYKSLFT
jgi:glycosyltransferase involved in cell wall biosynthesis